jgi:RNA polymerase sigma-70 factor, ECF subfamily
VTFSNDRTDAQADLVARAAAGDGHAVAAIYDLYVDGIYRFALAHVGQPADAEDVTQRVFLKMIEGLPGYQERGLPFGAWLFRIARNIVIDRRRSHRPMLSLELAPDLGDEERDPAHAAEAQAEREAIQAALGMLTAEQRDVVTLRFFGGLSHAEIAAILGKREATVRGLQFRGLSALRGRLVVQSDPGPKPEGVPA